VPVPVPARATLSIHSSDPGHVIAAYSPLILACFTRQVKAEEMAIIGALAAQGLDAGIEGGLLYVIGRREIAGGIDPRARALFEQMVQQNATRSGVSAVVVLTRGFAGAMLRGVATGLLQLTGKRKLLQIFSRESDACKWLALHHELDEDTLMSAYERATAHLRASLPHD
jgi:hypothetical protein